MNIDCIRTDSRPTYGQMNEVCTVNVVYFTAKIELLKAKLICYIPPTDYFLPADRIIVYKTVM